VALPSSTTPATAGGGENDYRYEIIAGETWTPTPKWVVNTIVSYGKWTEQDTSPSFGYSPTTLGLPSATEGLFKAYNTYSEFNVENFSQIGYSSYADTPHETDGLQFNISHELNRHSLKFGFLGEIQRLYPATISSPNFNFNSGMTAGPTPIADGSDSGNSIASLLLGTGNSGDVAYQTKLDLQQLNFGWYVQDTWRATNRLTVTAGLRHDIQNSRTERFNRLNTFDGSAVSPLATATGLSLTGGLSFANSHNRGLWDAQHTNFDPRISLAYKVTDKLVARAGYGIFNPNTLRRER
jgi:outer membrane receptor protein involved in Fe transport